MNIFKKKKNKPDVCGYLDLNGKFYTDRYERDLEDQRLKRNQAFKAVENKFEDIIYRYRREQSFLYGEVKYDYDLRHFIKNVNKEDKAKMLELYAKYIKLSEDETE